MRSNVSHAQTRGTTPRMLITLSAQLSEHARRERLHAAKSRSRLTHIGRLQASGTVDMTDAATLAAILGATATSLTSTAPGSVTVPTADQLTATAQLLGRVNTLALAASNVQARAQIGSGLTKPGAGRRSGPMRECCSSASPCFRAACLSPS